MAQRMKKQKQGKKPNKEKKRAKNDNNNNIQHRLYVQLVNLPSVDLFIIVNAYGG